MPSEEGFISTSDNRDKRPFRRYPDKRVSGSYGKSDNHV